MFANIIMCYGIVHLIFAILSFFKLTKLAISFIALAFAEFYLAHCILRMK